MSEKASNILFVRSVGNRIQRISSVRLVWDNTVLSAYVVQLRNMLSMSKANEPVTSLYYVGALAPVRNAAFLTLLALRCSNIFPVID